MKQKSLTKVFTLLLVLILAFCMTACGETSTDDNSADDSKVITSIEIGGDFGTIDLTGKACGEYMETELPDEFLLEDNETAVAYSCEDSDTPLIIVKESTNVDQTFEEYAIEQSEKWGNGYYQLYNDGKNAYYTGTSTLDGTFLYWDDIAYDFGDTIKVVTFFKRTEEVQLGDSDLYFNIPTGYENKLCEDDEIFGTSVNAIYDESYYFPNVYALNGLESYEKEKAFYSTFLKNFNLTEEHYNECSSNWTMENTREYFETLGFEVLYDNVEKNDDFNVYSFCVLADNCTDSDATWYEVFDFVERNDKWYIINTYSEVTDHTPSYMKAMVDSIHVKK